MKKRLCVALIFMIMLTVLPDGIDGWKTVAMATEPTIVQVVSGDSHVDFAYSLVDGKAHITGYNGNGENSLFHPNWMDTL